MISCTLARNAFKPWDRERWLEPHSVGGRVGDYIPAGTGEVIAYRNSALAEVDDLVGPDDSLAFIGRPGTGVEIAGFSKLVVGIAKAYVLGEILNLLFPPPRLSGPKKRDDKQSATYSFDGVGNNRTEGQPIPIVYGEMRVGGSVIGEYVKATSLFPVRTDLHSLFCFGEGPIHSIGGVEADNSPSTPLGSEGADELPTGIVVNGNTADNYNGLEAHVRMGTQEQNVIPGFEATRQAYSVDQKLTAEETDNFSNGSYYIQRGGGLEYDDTNDALWTEHAVGYDLNVEDVDEFIARIRFPNGYFRQDQNTGGLVESWFSMQARYRELDSLGTPITTGGPAGDGWVRLPIVDRIAFTKHNSFEWEYRQPFIDKDTYLDPVLGYALACGGAGSMQATTDQYPHSSGSNVNAISVSYWFFVPEDGMTGGNAPTEGEWFHMLGDYRHSVKKGWGLGLVGKAHFNGSTNDPTRWSIAVEHGNNTSRFVDIGTPVITPDAWHHVVMTYEFEIDGAGSNNRMRVWFDDEQVIDKERTNLNGITAVGSSENHLRISENPFGFDTSIRKVTYDDVNIWSSVIPSGVARQLWNAGRGTSALIRPTTLVANYNWDTDGAPGLANNAAPTSGGPWYGSMAFLSSTPLYGPGGGVTGVIAGNSTGDLQKGQYRVEVLRTNYESTDPRTTNVANFDVITSVINAGISYTNLALCGLMIPATDQLNTSIPNVTFLVKGKLCPVWDGFSETNPGVSYQWTQNPAWIVLDLLTNRRYGLGQFYEIKDIVLPDLLEWANYCDESVYDGGLQQVMTNDTTDEVLYTATTADADTAEVRGSLHFYINPANFSNEAPPSTWKVGARIYITGFPSSGGSIANDINSDTGTPADFAGYEIYEIARQTTGALAWIIKVYWDRTGEADPWGTGDFLISDVGEDFANHTAVVSGGQPRFAFNGVFDSHRRAWDAILEVCSVGRAMPIREGRRIRFKHNRPRAAVGVIGLGSIIEGSFSMSYGGLAHRPNIIEVSILDEDRQYESITTDARADELNPSNVGNVRKETKSLFGVTNRHQAERVARFEVLANEKLERTATWEMGANGLEYEPGDVVRLAHDILPRGTSGRVWKTTPGGVQDRFYTDRALTIAADTTYNVYIHTADDVVVSAVVDTSVTVPNDYDPGDEIRLTADSGIVPAQDDVFILVADGSELLMEITNVTLDPDMSKTVEAIEYNADIYADENDSPASEQLTMQGGDPLSDLGGTLTNPVYETTLPENPRDLTLSDRFVRTGPGQFLLVVHATWRLEPQDRPHVVSTAIWMRERSADAAEEISGSGADPVGGYTQRSSVWRQIATVSGADEFAEVPIPQGLVGRQIDIAVCPVKGSGVHCQPSESAWRSHELTGFGPHPSAAVGLDADLRAQKVTYSWTPTPGEEDALIELRRTSYQDPVVAGWILAPVCYRGLPGDSDSPPIRDWAGSTENGLTRIMSRMVNPLGHKSDLAVKAFNPSPTLDSFDPAIDDDDVNWSSYSDSGTNWLPAAPQTGFPLVVDLAETGEFPDNYLSFTGSSLTGRWTGAYDEALTSDLEQFRRAREYYVEAVLVAEQVHPLALIGDGELGDPMFERWTLEGPTHLRPGEENCTLQIQARFNIDGTSTGWESWQNFRPGSYTFVQVQFRIKVTRPDTTYDLKIHKLETRISAPTQGIEARPPYTAALDREFFD